MGHCLSVADIELGLKCPKCGCRGGKYIEGELAYHCGNTYSIRENFYLQHALKERAKREAANPELLVKRLEQEAGLMLATEGGSESPPNFNSYYYVPRVTAH